MSFAAEDDGRIVGAVLCSHNGRRGFLDHLAVHPAYRGRGIARSLIERCAAMLYEARIEKCVVAVLKESPSARAFWEHLGFVTVGMVDFYLRTHRG
ncbi:MAG: GNAT family N-acetyltransferase [Chitinivibrionales bacterium]|nr:GNAT family N-acetyltransferase [Chitinivibrionales bacterium]